MKSLSERGDALSRARLYSSPSTIGISSIIFSLAWITLDLQQPYIVAVPPSAEVSVIDNQLKRIAIFRPTEAIKREVR